MNNCSQAPQTERTRSAALEYLDSWDRAGMDWDAWIEEVEGARADFASLIGARPEEVAVSTSVSVATSGLASALDFTSGRSGVVISGAEFPTVSHVWLAQQARGARVRYVPVHDGVLHPQDYDGAIDGDTLIVSACHGYYQTGFVQDIRAIARMAHERGALVFVDAYQTLGTRPVDVKSLEVDFLASGCLKFLMGIPGLAFLYVREALIAELYPTVTGWFGRVDPYAFGTSELDWPGEARRFDTGTPPLINAYVCRAGVRIIREVGPERIREWHAALARRLIDGGRARGLELLGTEDVDRRTASTAFLIPPGIGVDSHEIERRLRRRGIIASARGPAIRLAPHFYSTLGDVDAALDALAEAFRE